MLNIFLPYVDWNGIWKQNKLFCTFKNLLYRSCINLKLVESLSKPICLWIGINGQRFYCIAVYINLQKKIKINWIFQKLVFGSHYQN